MSILSLIRIALRYHRGIPFLIKGTPALNPEQQVRKRLHLKLTHPMNIAFHRSSIIAESHLQPNTDAYW